MNNNQIAAKQQVELPSHESLSALALNDPKAFELLRQELVDRLIENAPARLKPRLLGIQFRVDGLRRLSKTALGSTVRISKLMWESFYNLNNALNDLSQLKLEDANVESKLREDCINHPTAKILAFRQRKTTCD